MIYRIPITQNQTSSAKWIGRETKKPIKPNRLTLGVYGQCNKEDNNENILSTTW